MKARDEPNISDTFPINPIIVLFSITRDEKNVEYFLITNLISMTKRVPNKYLIR